jgi:DNA-binding response OmpR family regulator
VSAQFDGAAGLKAAVDLPADLVVLDLGLPGLDGLSVLAGLREAGSSARVLILTARGEVEQRVRGLKAGADDYMAKPFSMDELVARIEALGRRGATPTAADLLDVADLRMDVHHRRVSRAGRPIALSPREFDVLQLLMQEPGRVFSRTELCERVWQRDHEYDTRTVEIFITRLRKKVDSGFAARSSTPNAPSATRSAPRMTLRYLCALASLSCLAAMPGVGAPAQAAAEGAVKLPKPLHAPVMNKRYGIVAYGGVLTPYPPVAVVYLEGAFPRPAAPATATMAQKDLNFVPVLLPVQVGTRVEFPNLDDTYHNIFSYSPAKRFDLGRYRSDERPVPSEVFDVAGPGDASLRHP